MSSADERIINRLQRIYDAQGAGGAAFSELTGEPTDNAALGSVLSAKVPTSRTVNGQALSGNVVVTGLMLDTAGAPDNGVGANGDFAFDDATKTIYGPKAAGVWPAGVVLGASVELASGTYTPTPSGSVNLDSDPTVTPCQYMRVGSVVTVAGQFASDPTLTATTTSFRLDLPIASSITNSYEAGGVAASSEIAGMVAAILGNNADIKIEWKATDVTIRTWQFSFTYQIIP